MDKNKNKPANQNNYNAHNKNDAENNKKSEVDPMEPHASGALINTDLVLHLIRLAVQDTFPSRGRLWGVHIYSATYQNHSEWFLGFSWLQSVFIALLTAS